MAKCGILYSDGVRFGAVTAGSQLAAMPAANLANPRLSAIWRAQPSVTATYVIADLGSLQEVDTVALLWTSLTPYATARIRLSTTDANGLNNLSHDSGPIPAGVDPQYPHVLYYLSSPVNARYVRVDVSDTSAPWLEAARLVAGARWTPSHNYTIGWRDAAVDDAQIVTVWGGGEWRDRRAVRRRVRITIPALPQAEAMAHGLALQRLGGVDDVLFVFDAADRSPRRAIFGRLEDVEMIGTFAQRMSVSFEITERR